MNRSCGCNCNCNCSDIRDPSIGHSSACQQPDIIMILLLLKLIKNYDMRWLLIVLKVSFVALFVYLSTWQCMLGICWQ